MNAVSDPDVNACFKTTMSLLFCCIRILLLEIVRWSKKSPKKFIYNGDFRDIPRSENELLDLQEIKFKLAFDKLMERCERKYNEINHLVKTTREFNTQDWDLLYEFNTSNYELCPTTKSKRKLQQVANQIRLMLLEGVHRMLEYQFIKLIDRVNNV